MKTKKSKSQLEMEQKMIRGVLRSFLFYLPILLGFMAFAISLTLGCFIAGLTGVIMIVKKESPSGIAPTRGKSAIIGGVLLTTFFWSGAILFFFIEFLYLFMKLNLFILFFN